MEQYLRIYCNYYQDDWSQLLSLVEFVYNNAKNASTSISPFYANYGYHLQAILKILPSEKYENPAAEAYIDHVQWVHEELWATLEYAQARYKKNFDKKVAAALEFKIGDLVWLNQKNIEMMCPSWKLDFWQWEPFEIVKVVGESKAAFELKLQPQWHIHPIFHASLLDSYRRNKIEGRKQLVLLPPEIIEAELKYEIEEILDLKIQRNKLWYLVEGKGYGLEKRT